VRGGDMPYSQFMAEARDGRVDSVTVGSDGLYLDLPGLGTVPLDYVLRVS